MDEHLTSRVKVVEAIDATAGAAGTSDINGAVIDMAGFEAIAFMVVFGAITANGVQGIRLQRDTVEAFDDDPQDIAGSAQAVADDADGKTFISDLFRPGERYVRGVVDRATQNSAVRAAFYLLYGAREKPVSQGSTVTVEQLKDKAEGSA
jgi:hypothetical protein